MDAKSITHQILGGVTKIAMDPTSTTEQTTMINKTANAMASITGALVKINS